MLFRYNVLLALITNASIAIAENTTITADALTKLVQDFENFKKQLDSVDARLKAIQNALTQGVRSDDSKCAARTIIDAINDRRFDLAENKLNEITDPKTIKYIVHDVYADTSINFDKIVEFTKNLNNTESQFLFFNAILNEIRSGRDSDPIKLIEIVNSLESVMSKLSDETFTTRLKQVIHNAIEDIETASVSMLRLAMIKNKYQHSKEIADLTTALFEFRADVSNNVMIGVVDSAIGVVSASRIMDCISSQKYIPQVIEGFKAIFNRLKIAGSLNNDAILNLALHLRMLTRREKYNQISAELKDDVTKIIEQLPMCSRNLCLWNKGRGEYLYPTDTSTRFDEERRGVCTWHPRGDVPGAGAADQKKDSFFLKNNGHLDMYLYSVRTDYNKDKGYVSTRNPGRRKCRNKASGSFDLNQHQVAGLLMCAVLAIMPVLI